MKSNSPEHCKDCGARIGVFGCPKCLTEAMAPILFEPYRVHFEREKEIKEPAKLKCIFNRTPAMDWW